MDSHLYSVLKKKRVLLKKEINQLDSYIISKNNSNTINTNPDMNTISTDFTIITKDLLLNNKIKKGAIIKAIPINHDNKTLSGFFINFYIDDKKINIILKKSFTNTYFTINFSYYTLYYKYVHKLSNKQKFKQNITTILNNTIN